MSAPGKSQSMWGSFLSHAVTGIESRLDNMLEEESQQPKTQAAVKPPSVAAAQRAKSPAGMSDAKATRTKQLEDRSNVLVRSQRRQGPPRPTGRMIDYRPGWPRPWRARLHPAEATQRASARRAVRWIRPAEARRSARRWSAQLWRDQ